MRKPKRSRHSPIRAEDLKRFPLPNGLFWLGEDWSPYQILHAKYGHSGYIMACAIAVLLDRDFPPPDAVDIGVPGFHAEYGGRWFCMEFPLRLPRRKCLAIVKKAVRVMGGQV